MSLTAYSREDNLIETNISDILTRYNGPYNRFSQVQVYIERSLEVSFHH